MALAPFFGRRNNFWDTPDPFDMVVSVFDNTPASSFARDARAVASTNVDWKETPTEHVFKADLPGLKKEEVQVQVEDGRTLSISGQRKKEEVQKTDTWHRVERSSGQFMRKFRLPENANLDHITAKVENGVLTVLVPKEEKKKPQTRSIHRELILSSRRVSPVKCWNLPLTSFSAPHFPCVLRQQVWN